MSFLTKIFGDPNKRVLLKYAPTVARIQEFAPAYAALTHEELKNKTVEFRARLAAGETLDDLLPSAFAAVSEAAGRTISQRHYDVQLMGGIALHQGTIAEMRTGEGKTLTGTLPVYLQALLGRGVHVVTVNDYLAKRDAVWMGQIYAALGMSVGIIQAQMVSYIYDAAYRAPQVVTAEGVTDEGSSADKQRDESGSYHVAMDYLRPSERRAAYAADITYGTNNEFGFDYLRDNMVGSSAELSQRDLHYALIDEVDSILIDEARTPLIISAPAEEAPDTYYQCAHHITQLKETEHYTLDEKQRTASLTASGIARMEELLKIDNLYAAGGHRLVHHVDSALRAHALFKRDRDYVVKNDEVIIVDEFTGRLMFGRRYSEGLHQAIEAKEGVTVQRESQTLATVTFQNYFRLYGRLAGMTGTAVTEAEEFNKIYQLEVVVIPPYRLSARVDHGDRIYRSEEGKFSAVVAEVKARHERGQPVLIGTISIDKNERLATLLEREGIPYQMLNAKNHEKEGEIIAQAGRRGAVTLATNMAGRGVDIILGGQPVISEDQEFVRSQGGLCVIGTERHESRRIDNQLRGRSGRQGDQGETLFFVSTEDDLMRIFGSDRMKNLMRRLNVPEDMPIEHGLISKSIETAQKKVEGHNFDIRKHLLEYDDVLNRHREVIYKKRREILAASEREDGLDELLHIVDWMFEQEIEQLVFQYANVPARGESDDATTTLQTEARASLTRLLRADEQYVEKLLAPIHETGSANEPFETRTAVIEPAMALAQERLRNVVGPLSASVARTALKNILLRSQDALWIEHLDALNYLRTGIGLRGYGQKDPLVEYKKESYRLFQELLVYIQKDVVYAVLYLDQALAFAPNIMAREGVVLSGPEAADDGDASALPVGPKVGRNDPCPCGSGKKYKKCHGG